MDDDAPAASRHMPEVACAQCRDTIPAGRAAALGLGVIDSEILEMRHRYVCEGMSVRRMAKECGIRRQRLAHLLRAIGVEVMAAGAGRPRAWARSPDPESLRETLALLYSELHLSSVQIGELLGIPDRRIRLRLREFGIRRRPRGRTNREDRHQVDAHVLTELMKRGDLPGTEVSQRTGEPYLAVLRSAHALGLPVQAGGQPSLRGKDHIRTIDALYSDVLVCKTLRRFGVPAVPAGEPLWQRFPEPVMLTPQLLGALYLECGLSTVHIELLTGQPASTVQRRLHEFHIPLRAAGGRAPIWLQWRAVDGAS